MRLYKKTATELHLHTSTEAYWRTGTSLVKGHPSIQTHKHTGITAHKHAKRTHSHRKWNHTNTQTRKQHIPLTSNTAKHADGYKHAGIRSGIRAYNRTHIQADRYAANTNKHIQARRHARYTPTHEHAVVQTHKHTTVYINKSTGILTPTWS